MFVFPWQHRDLPERLEARVPQEEYRVLGDDWRDKVPARFVTLPRLDCRKEAGVDVR